MSEQATRDRVIEWGTVPCSACGKAHCYRDDDRAPGYRTWRAFGDGHGYREMSAIEVMRHFGLTAERDSR